MAEAPEYIPPGDEELAATLRRLGAADLLLPEDIVLNDWLVTSLNRDKLKIGRGERVVQLACGNEIVTKNRHRAACPYCRYLLVHGYDYDGFRRLGLGDPLAGYWHLINLRSERADG